MMDEAISSDSESGDGILHGTQVTKLLRLNKEEEEGPVGENDSKSKQSGQVCTDLLILGLPYKLEENELKTYFEQFGAVELAEVISKTLNRIQKLTFVGRLFERNYRKRELYLWETCAN